MSDKQDSAIVIRYSKEVMIGLHDSPLVQKPESMPSLLSWFGEDPNSPASKNLLNGVIMSRPPNDKSIILGPTKTNFASSLYGGLKRTDDNNNTISKTQHASNSTRHNHRQLDERSNNNNTCLKEYRSHRGPSFMGEKGFSHNKSSDRKFTASSPPNKRNDRYNNNDRINDNLKNNGRNLHNNRNNRHNNNSNINGNHYHDFDTNERVPEWMDYSPETEMESKEEDIQAQFANDLEAWKSNMKKREGIQETAIVEKKKPVEESLATLSITEPMKQQDPLGFFEEPTVITSPEQRRDQKGGSRFAKFFAKREEPTIEPTPNQEQPRSISLNDLFQQGPTQPPAALQSTYSYNNDSQEQQQEQQQQQQLRVFSEEDILKSLGAKKTANEPTKSNNQNNEDAMGFNRVLQILSQPKPSLQQQNEAVIEEKASPKIHTSNKGSPMMTGSPAGNPDNKPSSSTSRFGNNLPTSVLRQMSARSSEGRSPSLSSTKSTPPISHTSSSTNMRYSPAMKQHLPPHLQQQQLPNGIPLPPQQYFPYQQQQQHYSPGHPMMDHRSFEQLIQFNNTGGMPPPPPHLRNSNGTNGEFLPPHMMMRPPLPPGQRPMMTPPPPHHFTQQQLQQLMQQQQQQQQQQRDMMPPMPPHVMTNGIPPQLFNKNQGWDRQ